MDFIDRSLEMAPFSSKHILNFLHSGPPEERPDDVPDFDWRDIFNLTDRVIRMLNQYGDVSGCCFFLGGFSIFFLRSPLQYQSSVFVKCVSVCGIILTCQRELGVSR